MGCGSSIDDSQMPITMDEIVAAVRKNPEYTNMCRICPECSLIGVYNYGEELTYCEYSRLYLCNTHYNKNQFINSFPREV